MVSYEIPQKKSYSLNSSSFRDDFLKQDNSTYWKVLDWNQESSNVDPGMWKIARLLDPSQAEFEYTMFPRKGHLIFPKSVNEIYILQKDKISG